MQVDPFHNKTGRSCSGLGPPPSDGSCSCPGMEAEGRPETDGEHLSERASAAAVCADWGGEVGRGGRGSQIS